MAIVFPKFPRGGLSPQNGNREGSCPILTRICGLKPSYTPGTPLTFEILLTPTARESCNAVEVSVIWYTEGKGTEDLNVHFFRRLAGSQLTDAVKDGKLSYRSDMPAGPLSYHGRIVSICWAVRVRIFMSNGEVSSVDRSFQLIS